MASRRRRATARSLAILLSMILLRTGVSFLPSLHPRKALVTCHHETVSDNSQDVADSTELRPCYWNANPPSQSTRPAQWKERLPLNELQIGQELEGYVVQELLEGKTGPKVFVECGVGRRTKNNWAIVNGMMRLPRAKESVVRKRVSRLRKKSRLQVYVSRLFVDDGRFEVCASPEEVESCQPDQQRVPVSSLKAGQEVTGRVTRVLPFGVMVDVGANRVGLLHIRKVAVLYGKYIDKIKGLENAGLERGARVRLAVASIEQRRLELDFTSDVKNEAAAEQAQKTKPVPSSASVSYGSPEDSATGASDLSADHLATWEEFASKDASESTTDSSDTNEDVDEDEEEYDDYDEERDIEDQLGLGYY